MVLPERIATLTHIPESAFFSFLDKRKWMLEGVSICGGEPTLQPDLYDFCARVKEKWFQVKLDTNGRDPQILQRLIENKLVDYIAMDIKQEWSKWDTIIGVSISDMMPYYISRDILLQGEVEYEFRTTCIAEYHTPTHIAEIAKSITGAKQYYLQNFKKSSLLDSKMKASSCRMERLQEFQQEAKKYVEKCEIRV